MRFYVASGLANAAEVKRAIIRLGRDGKHHCTYDWTEKGSVRNDSPAVWTATALNEVGGASRADVLIAMLPGGKGTHVEIGIALGLGRPVLLVVPDDGAEFCVFYHHPHVIFMRTIEEAHAFLDGCDYMASCQ